VFSVVQLRPLPLLMTSTTTSCSTAATSSRMTSRAANRLHALSKLLTSFIAWPVPTGADMDEVVRDLPQQWFDAGERTASAPTISSAEPSRARRTPPAIGEST
jgi:hypothetical protein